jgi:hypothetical protein
VHRLRHQSNTTAPVARSGGAPNSQIVVLFEVPYCLLLELGGTLSSIPVRRRSADHQRASAWRVAERMDFFAQMQATDSLPSRRYRHCGPVCSRRHHRQRRHPASPRPRPDQARCRRRPCRRRCHAGATAAGPNASVVCILSRCRYGHHRRARGRSRRQGLGPR